MGENWIEMAKGEDKKPPREASDRGPRFASDWLLHFGGEASQGLGVGKKGTEKRRAEDC